MSASVVVMVGGVGGVGAGKGVLVHSVYCQDFVVGRDYEHQLSFTHGNSFLRILRMCRIDYW